MDFKYINIDKIKLGHIKINNNGNIDIPILYKNDELTIKIPEKKNGFFEVHEFDKVIFKYYITLEFMENMYEFEEEYKNMNEIINNQKDSKEFSNFIVNLKNRIMALFYNELKINKNYLNVNFNDLNLEAHEIDKPIWDENIDFSYTPEIKEMSEEYRSNDLDDDSEEDFEIILRRRFHVNKKTKKEENLYLKCNIVFFNKKLENENEKKNIYINWNVI